MSTAAHRDAFAARWPVRLAWLLFVAYLVYAAATVDFSFSRFVDGLGNAARLLGRMFPPDFTRWELVKKGLLESLEIAVLASFLGIAVSLPLGLAAARNLMPAWLTWPARGFIAAARSLHPVIVAILFVKAVGFGALPGILALTLASVGFIGKLFAEAIEEISPRQVEAIRATGAPFASLVSYGVMPQVLSRFVGLATYQLDSNLRNSTMVGIVGAGGVGGTLLAAFQRFDYDFVCGILVAIIALIMLGEIVSVQVRRIFASDARTAPHRD
jgi:phosphonate transport system permease protein